MTTALMCIVCVYDIILRASIMTFCLMNVMFQLDLTNTYWLFVSFAVFLIMMCLPVCFLGVLFMIAI